MDYQIQVIIVPVSDVDQAAAFYTRQVGFTLDVDYYPATGFRVVQLTPPGSACSLQIGVGLTHATPGSPRLRELRRLRRPRGQHLGAAGDRLSPRHPPHL
jgi:catechol 2,3-dioxygenase-like lactoylglutathione lyase family enzyme